MSPAVEAVLALVHRGFKVFPVLPGQKRPALSGWQEWAINHSNEEDIKTYAQRHPGCNWGVYCGGSGLVVVDIDNKTDRDGYKSLERLEAENSVLPDTFMVGTPSGGKHFYYRGKYPNTADKFGTGIDTRGTGGYVVAPGSMVHGKVYKVLHDVPVVDLPPWLLEITPEVEPLERPEDKHVAESIAEGSRDSTLTRWAGVLRAQGLTYEELVAALLVMNAERCDPPMPDGQVRKIAASISKKPRGNALAVADFFDVADSEKMVRKKDWPIPLSGFVPGEAKARRWILDEWLPVGEISSIYGAGSTGKSLLSLQLGISVAAGGKFLDMDVQEDMMYIGVYCEDSADELHRRVESIRKAPEFAFLDEKNMPNPCYLWPRAGLNNTLVTANNQDVVPGPFMPELRAFLETLPKHKPKLMVLDTLSDIYMGDENVREKVNKVVKYYMVALAQAYNLTILLLAHPSRTGQNTGDMLSGSTAWENAVRNRLALATKEDRTWLRRLKSNYAKRGAEIEIYWESGRFLPLAADEAEGEELRNFGDYLASRYIPGDCIAMTSVVEDLATDPTYGFILAGLNSEKRRREKLITLLRKELVRKGKVFNYHLKPSRKPRHWLMVEALGEDITFLD